MSSNSDATKKIAFLVPINGISGGLYVVYQHAHFLAGQGWDVEVLFSSAEHGTNVTSYRGFSLPTRTLAEAVQAGTRYDAVVATWWETFYEIFDLPSAGYFYFVQSDERRFYPAGDARVALVEETYRGEGVGYLTEARWIQTWLKQDFGQTAGLAPNGVDTRLFRPDVVPLAPRGGGRVRVLIEGPATQPFKRVDLAFRVAAQVPNLEIWYVCSDGEPQPEWRIDRFFPKRALDEMPAIYASCDVLLKLSTVEGFVGPPLEMMACGGTAVVSKATGWEEYLEHDRNCLLVELDDESGAVAALSRICKDSELRRSLSEAGIAKARTLDWARRLPLFPEALRETGRAVRTPVPGARLYAALAASRRREAKTLRESEAAHGQLAIYRSLVRPSFPQRILNRLRSFFAPRP